jgi:hypothetical protein
MHQDHALVAAGASRKGRVSLAFTNGHMIETNYYWYAQFQALQCAPAPRSARAVSPNKERSSPVPLLTLYRLRGCHHHASHRIRPTAFQRVSPISITLPSTPCSVNMNRNDADLRP